MQRLAICSEIPVFDFLEGGFFQFKLILLDDLHDLLLQLLRLDVLQVGDKIVADFLKHGHEVFGNAGFHIF